MHALKYLRSYDDDTQFFLIWFVMVLFLQLFNHIGQALNDQTVLQVEAKNRSLHASLMSIKAWSSCILFRKRGFRTVRLTACHIGPITAKPIRICLKIYFPDMRSLTD